MEQVLLCEKRRKDPEPDREKPEIRKLHEKENDEN